MEIESKVFYPELSKLIVGLAFKVYNTGGRGMPEKYCQKVLAEELKKANLHFIKECKVELRYEGKTVNIYFLDFIVEDKIVVELKVRSRMGYVDIKQVMGYLKATNKKLAILLYFTKDGVKFRRILNSYRTSHN